MFYLRCCSVISLTVISSCFSVYSSGPTAQEVIGARRVRAFLAGLGNPLMVGPAFKNVVEGNARDTGPIPGNAPDAQIEQQKRYIRKHIREHGHAGNNRALLETGEAFRAFVPYPSIFRIQGVNLDVANVNRICDEIVDILLSGMVSFEVGQMQALLPPAIPQPANNPVRSNRFLLVANLDGHRIFGLAQPPCIFNNDASRQLNQTGELSTYVQLVVSVQRRYNAVTYPREQNVFVTLFPAPNRPAGSRNALAPILYPPLTRLKYFIYDNKEKIVASALIVGAFLFMRYKLTNDSAGNSRAQPEL